jgi:hypothetical protein
MSISTIFQLYRGSFIGGGNQSTWRKPLTCRKSLTNLSHKVASSTPEKILIIRKIDTWHLREQMIIPRKLKIEQQISKQIEKTYL